MYYIELIHRFWSFNHFNKIGATAISVYLYLLKTANDNQRYDFKISDLAISKELGLTRKTVGKTREKLRRLGLIEFWVRKRVACSYRLIVNYPVHFLEADERKDVISEISDQLSEAGIVQHNNSLSESVDNDKVIPSFDEFLEYAESLEQYEPQLYLGVKAKYEFWKNNDWTSTANRPITNWKSSLKGALPFMKNLTSAESISLQSVPDIKRPKES